MPEIYYVTKGKLGAEWKEVVGERQLTSCIVADFGFADAVVCLMSFKGGTYEVGHGECMRPYVKLYSGTDLEAASKIWLKYVARL